MKARSLDQTAISVSIARNLLQQIDSRVESLGLTRSRYLAILAVQDLARGGPLTITAQDESQAAAPLEITPAALDFLRLAVPVLTQYQDSHGQSDAPQVGESLGASELWRYFLAQRDQILKDKWIDSRNAGYDIGMERALRAWLQKHQELWAEPDAAD